MAMEMEQDVEVPQEEPTQEEGMDQEMMSMFDGPIPGASLTEELGSEPNERPPQYVVPDEALLYVKEQINQPEAFERIVIAAGLDIPIELVARAIVFSGWALGKYTHDISLLIFGPVFGYMLDMLNEEGVDHVPLAERADDPDLEKAMALLADYKRFKGEGEQSSEENSEEQTEEEPMEMEEVDEPEETKVPETGLMGRREI
tara:strand:- start:4017 stop:4622 length:606 start_codon:yes stop_codon:yes gene_type:complete